MDYYGSINLIIGNAVLACPMGENDAEAGTVGEYLVKLLRLVWEEEEGFDGKRPFGNSGWKSEVYKALVEANLIKGKMTDGYLEDYDEAEADKLIDLAIDAMLCRRVDVKNAQARSLEGVPDQTADQAGETGAGQQQETGDRGRNPLRRHCHLHRDKEIRGTCERV